MSVKRTQVEQELVSRAKNKMALVGMAVTADGLNTSLDSPIATALRKMGFAVDLVADDNDLAALPSEKLDEFLDRAELRLLENIQGNFDLTNTRIGNLW